MIHKILFVFLLAFSFATFPNFSEIQTDVRPKYFYLSITSLIILIVLLFNITTKKLSLYTFRNQKNEISFLIFFMLLLGLVSTFVSVDSRLAWYGDSNRLEGFSTWFSYFLLIITSVNFIQTESLLNNIKIVSVFSVAISIYGILQHYYLDPFVRPIAHMHTNRSFAFFDNPNFFGSYLVLVLAITIMIYFLSSKKQSYLFLFIASAHFVALLYSQTRSAWLGVLVSLILFGVYFLFQKREYLKRYVIVGVTFVILFLVVNVTESGAMSSRFSSIVEDANSVFVEDDMHAGSSRMYIWRKSLPLIKEYFWFGSGPDTFAKVFPYDEEEYKQYFGTSNIIVDKAHNEYLQMAITMGVPALITYLALLFVILRKAFHALRIAQGNDFIMMLSFTAAIIGYLVQAFFNISVVTVAPYYWIFLGITYRLAENILEEKESPVYYDTRERQYIT